MRVVLVGASRFSDKVLRLAAGTPQLEVVGVVSTPEVFTISYRPSGVRNVLHADLVSTSRELSVPSTVMTGSATEFSLISTIKSWRPDILLVAGWYHMIPRSWRAIAPAFGVHASLLPDYSGGAPLVWAMINGETRTGITLFKMDDGVDSGPIVAQTEVPILPTDTIATLLERTESAGLDLLKRYLPVLHTSDLPLIAQNEAERRTMPQRSPEDGLIDWSRPSVEIDRFIRAQTRPYPGAFTRVGSEKVQIWRATPTIANPQLGSFKAGTVSCLDGTVVIAASDGFLRLEEVRFQGADLPGTDFANVLRK